MWKSLFQRATSSWIRPQAHRANPQPNISKEIILTSQDDSQKCLLLGSNTKQEDGGQKKQKRHTCHGNHNIPHKLNCGSFLETFGFVGTIVVLGLNLHEYCWKTRNILYRAKDGNKSVPRPPPLCGRICNLLLPFAFAMPNGQRTLTNNSSTLHKESTIDKPPEDPTAETNKEAEDTEDIVRISEDLQRVTFEYIGHLENMDGIEAKDEQKAFLHFQNGGKYGDSKAHFNLGVCYETGHGTKVDFHKAAEHYRIAASTGHILATYNLGVYYLEGKGGLPYDETQGLELIRKAAIQGVVPAQTHMGIHFTEQQDWSNAFPFLEKASSQDPEAQYYLALCYENGWGVSADQVRAFELYHEAAASGISEALYSLGLLYEKDIDGLENNLDLAMSFHQMAEAASHEAASERLKILRKKSFSKNSSHVPSKEVSKENKTLHAFSSVPELQIYRQEELPIPKHHRAISKYLDVVLPNAWIKPVSQVRFWLGDSQDVEEVLHAPCKVQTPAISTVNFTGLLGTA